MLRNAATLLRIYGAWVRQIPQATGLMFAARSPLGRSIKIFFFGVGVVLPLGSLIWALLFWHGNSIGKDHAAAASDPDLVLLPAGAIPPASADDSPELGGGPMARH